MNNTIYVVPHGGLCNRMRVINSVHYIAKKQNKKVVVFWRGQDIGCNSTKLFKKVENVIMLSELRWNHFTFLKKILNKFLYKYQYIAEKKADIILTEDEVNVLRQKNEEYVLELLTKHKRVFVITDSDLIILNSCKIFIPANSIQKQLEYEKNKLNWSTDIIGVHIRRTDNLISIENSPSYLFMEKIDAELKNKPETRFYLATDSKEEEAAFKNRYGDKILTMQDKSMSRFDEQGQKDAYVELLLLSSCKEIWGSYWSSYSEMAAHLSEIPLIKIRK